MELDTCYEKTLALSEKSMAADEDKKINIKKI